MKISTYASGLLVAGLTTLAPSVVPDALHAQSTRPTIIVLPESFLDVDARVAVVRQRGRDVVVLNPVEATPEALGVGLMLLRRLRRERPTPEHGRLVPVTGFAMTRPLSADQRARVEEALVRLRERPLVDVGSLGRGRWIPFGRP